MSEESKRGPGRPAGRTPVARISLEVPPGLRELVEAAAEREHLTLTAWIRRAMLAALAASTPGAPAPRR